MRAVIEALQSLGGVALVTTVTIAAEVGELSRFVKPRQIDWSPSVAAVPKCARSSSMRTGSGGTLNHRFVEWSAKLRAPVNIALGILFALLVLFVLLRVGRAIFPRM